MFDEEELYLDSIVVVDVVLEDEEDPRLVIRDLYSNDLTEVIEYAYVS